MRDGQVVTPVTGIKIDFQAKSHCWHRHNHLTPFILVPFPKCDFEEGRWLDVKTSPLNLTRSEPIDRYIHETLHLSPEPNTHGHVSANGCHQEVKNHFTIGQEVKNKAQTKRLNPCLETVEFGDNSCLANK